MFFALLEQQQLFVGTFSATTSVMLHVFQQTLVLPGLLQHNVVLHRKHDSKFAFACIHSKPIQTTS